MVTKHIGVKEFRQNMAKIAATAKKKKQRLVIFNRNEPILEVVPFDKKKAKAEFLESLKQASAEVKAGEFYTHKQMKKFLGLV